MRRFNPVIDKRLPSESTKKRELLIENSLKRFASRLFLKKKLKNGKESLTQQ